MSTTNHTSVKGRPTYLLGTLFLYLIPFMLSGSTTLNLLDRIENQGFLPILSSNGPITYYEGPFGLTGFEYELAEAFADSIGVELVVNDEPNLGDMLRKIGTDQGQFAAYSLAITEERKKSINFSTPYMLVNQQVIYRRGTPKPKTIEDLIGKDIVVAAKSSHAETMLMLRESYPELRWREEKGVEQLDLLEMVHSGRAEITLVDSTAFTVNRSIYPRARLAFNLPSMDSIAWAFPKSGDDSLYRAANRFLAKFRDSGQLEDLQKKYFGMGHFDEGGALTLSKHIDRRLPKWEQLFRETANEFHLDWLLLAAISYQESHWNAKARSYTGVRGLMMLTRVTAKQLGIKDRTNPKQSVTGGAKYFTQIRNRLPERIKNPDRTWMALAAYNVGLGHLEDARILTQRQGGNPDVWDDVKKSLPLLSKKKYYKQTKHGYARGWEPVKYVENIRNFHNILVWHHESQQRRLALELQSELEPASYSPPSVNGSGLSQL